ncbi:MAG TPA: hypothetical protein VMB80_11975 [Candidatus Acidoferrum sp.]|nr:hypothetical protein [Candidatus Acidoferrum sp.]
MNRERTVWPIGALFLSACFLFAVFVVKLHRSVPAPAIDAERAATRLKALAEIRAAEAEALDQPGWIDRSRGLVRLPIDLAMQITEREWQDPAAARSNLTARAEKAVPATTPAPAPGQPSQFE